MPHFSCYLPEGLLTRLDEQVRKTPRGNRSGIMREALEQLLDDQPTTVREVFSEALSTEAERGYDLSKGRRVSRADIFHRATQR